MKKLFILFSLSVLIFSCTPKEEITPQVEIENVTYIPDSLSNSSITLYNPAEVDQEIGGWKLRDPNQSGEFVISDSTTIYALAWLGYETSAFGFDILPDNQTIELLDVEGNLIDSYSR